jgi:hypothetical protein
MLFVLFNVLIFVITFNKFKYIFGTYRRGHTEILIQTGR